MRPRRQSFFLRRWGSGPLIISPTPSLSRRPRPVIAIMIGKIWDAVMDPLMGYISDRTNRSSAGEGRISFSGAIPMGFANVVFFTNPHIGSQGTLLVWAAIALCFLNTAYTVVNIPLLVPDARAHEGLQRENEPQRLQIRFRDCRHNSRSGHRASDRFELSRQVLGILRGRTRHGCRDDRDRPHHVLRGPRARA